MKQKDFEKAVARLLKQHQRAVLKSVKLKKRQVSVKWTIVREHKRRVRVKQ